MIYPRHKITVEVVVESEEEWADVFSMLNDFVEDMGDVYPSVTLSSKRLDEEVV